MSVFEVYDRGMTENDRDVCAQMQTFFSLPCLELFHMTKLPDIEKTFQQHDLDNIYVHKTEYLVIKPESTFKYFLLTCLYLMQQKESEELFYCLFQDI